MPPQTPAPTGSPAAKGEDISYAKNPERFVKYPTDPPKFNITDPKTPQEHFNMGVYLDNQKQYAKAAEEYGKAVAQKPDWALAYARAGRDYDHLGRTDDAITQWQQALKYDPQFYSMYDLLAGAYERKGDLRKAVEAYNGLLKYPPAQLPAHYQLGLWYAKLGDRQNARSHLQQYLQLAAKMDAEKESGRFQTATRTLQTVTQ